jgi:hypothetical protein
MNTADRLSVSAGIAMPSFATAIFQNPADIVATPALNLNFQGGINDTFTNATVRGGLAYGTDTFGMAAGGSYLNPSSTFVALSAGFKSARVSRFLAAFGLSGSIGSTTGSGSSVNAGVLVHPIEMLNVGLTAMGLATGNTEWGGGVGFSFGEILSVVIDSAFGRSFNYLGVQPGLKLGAGCGALTFSYGIGSGSTQISNGLAGGMALNFGKVNLELYYNRFTTFYTAISIQL